MWSRYPLNPQNDSLSQAQDRILSPGVWLPIQQEPPQTLLGDSQVPGPSKHVALIKDEHALSQTKHPYMISGIFLNEGLLKVYLGHHSM